MRARKFGWAGVAVLLLLAGLWFSASRGASPRLLLVQNNGQLRYTLTNSSPTTVSSQGGLGPFIVNLQWTVGPERFTATRPASFPQNWQFSPGEAATAIVGIPTGAIHVTASVTYTAHPDLYLFARELSRLCPLLSFERWLIPLTEQQTETGLDLVPVPPMFR